MKTDNFEIAIAVAGKFLTDEDRKAIRLLKATNSVDDFKIKMRDVIKNVLSRFDHKQLIQEIMDNVQSRIYAEIDEALTSE